MNKVKETLIQIYDKVIEEDKIYLVKLNGKYGVVDKTETNLSNPNILRWEMSSVKVC